MEDLKLLKEEVNNLAEVLKKIEARGTVSGRILKFLYFQLLDSYRLAIMAIGTYNFGLSSTIFTAEVIEVLARNVVEKAILCAYIKEKNDTVFIDQFLKTSASEFEKSWEIEYFSEDKNLQVKNLPDYKTMSNCLDIETYKTFKKLSYLSHPRFTLPYSLVEHEYIEKRKTTKMDFYIKRGRNALGVIAQALKIVRKKFEESDKELLMEKILPA